jgi:hypothetical protein
MADVKISQLPDASALVAGDLLPVVQDDSGLVTRKATASQIAAYVRTIAGTVRQVVTASTTAPCTVLGNVYADTTLTATITPVSTSSRILVIVSQSLEVGAAAASCYAGLRILRGATVIHAPVSDADGPYDFGMTAAGCASTEVFTRASMVVVDSPNTASAVTYKTQLAAYTGSSAEAQVDGGGVSHIVLVEIAG